MQKGCKRKYFFNTFYKILFFMWGVNIKYSHNNIEK